MKSKQGRVGDIFKMKNEIAGPKKMPQEATAISNPATGELIVNKDKIKEITLNYCVENLKNNTPDDEVKEVVETRKQKQLKRMQDKSGEGFEVTYEEFDQVLAKYEMKETETYDYIIKAGKRYKFSIYKISKRIIDNEEIPNCFRITILYMIWKRRGKMNILKHNRFLHMKQVLARTVDSIVVKQMKEGLISNSKHVSSWRPSWAQYNGTPPHPQDSHGQT